MAKDVEANTAELVAIKKLLVLALLRDGLTQNHIAGALGVDRSAVSRMFSKGTLTGISKRGKTDE